MADLHAKLEELENELAEGDITRKGYEKRRTMLLQEFGVSERQQTYPPDNAYPSLDPLHFDDAPAPRQLSVANPSSSSFLAPSESYNESSGSRTHTLARSDYAWRPPEEETSMSMGKNQPEARQRHDSQAFDSRMSTMLDAQQQNYFSDFGDAAQETYGGPQRYSATEALSPTAMQPMQSSKDLPSTQMINHQLPLEPRDIPFSITDPHAPNTAMSQFESIGSVLRYRGKLHPRQAAYWVLDVKGKEIASITWDKLASKAEKVAQVIRDKSNLYRGDRVALIYKDSEIIDFVIALVGCFIAGVVAVPLNSSQSDYQKLSLLLTTTQAHLALTTDSNLKNFHRDITANKLKWPSGVEWWKTNEFGSYNSRKKDEQSTLQVPDLAYIEFSRAPTGDLRGVVLSHRTVMHQVATLTAMISAIPSGSDTMGLNLRDRSGNPMVNAARTGEILLSYLDPREGVGLILGVLLTIYGGHTTIWMDPKSAETPGLYAHLITKYRATVLAADYSRLKYTAYNYQQDPMATRKFAKGTEPNFSSVKICLIDTLTVDCEFHEILADRWFKPMHNLRPREVVAPMLCLPEHGGSVISVRDWLGGAERMGCPLGQDGDETDDGEPGESSPTDPRNALNSFQKQSSRKESRADLAEVLLDKEAIKSNEVVVVAFGEDAKRRAGEPSTIRVGAFGYPITDATLAVVDPETSLLCSPYTVGEIWVDSPSLSGGFWALPKHTEAIFHSHPYRFIEGSPFPVTMDLEFLRTGLLGFVIEGKVFVLGLYEDRIRQKVEWIDPGLHEPEHRYFFVQHLVSTVMKHIPKIHDCSAFDVYVNGEYLPIILLETFSASTAPLVPGGPPRQLEIPLLDSLSERCMEVLYAEHHLRVYCVMITAPNTLPRVIKNGRPDIGNMLCRKEFDNGNLPCVHVQFGVGGAVQNLPVGDDILGGIWSSASSSARLSILGQNEKQYSGVDHRDVIIDDRTSTPLNTFSNVQDLLQWRANRQSDELAYCTIDSRGKEGKGVPWKKLDLKICAVALYLKNKVKIQAGDHLLLMYTHSEDFVYAVHACWVLGAVAIPMAPLDQNRLSEDAPALLSMIADFRIKAILVNNDTEQLLKQKVVSQHLKQSANVLKCSIPSSYNTSKPHKQSQGCRDSGLTMKPAWIQQGYPALIWVYWTPDQRRVAVQLGHRTIMALCKVQKETCQMTSTRPILACVRSTVGLGFIHMCLMGIYLAAPTYLVSPVDFAQNPMSLFLALARYKVKDTYATSQMLDHAMAHVPGKGFALHELKNLMISTDTRPRTDVYQRTRAHFAPAGLDRTSINTIYSHVLNPMIASRSYMCIEPVEIWLDSQALRRGLVQIADPEIDPYALYLQDSGMVPVSTQIAIVNPETNRLCYAGEYGEIWVQSEATAHSFYGSRDPLDAERMNGRTVDGDPNVRYMRTGDLGFLHNLSRPIGPGGAHVDMQVLFMLGSIGETFDINGLSHFPCDIENTIEKCHRNVAPGGSAVFQAGGLVVALVEVVRRNYLASIVPVIVNSVLNQHQLVLDIVAFVSRGDFPRSRLGEKQRGKILAGWVTRKMRTIAQFGIKDPDGPIIDDAATGTVRRSGHSFRSGSMRGGSSLKHVESSSALTDMQGRPYAPPESVAELPADDNSIMDSSPEPTQPAVAAPPFIRDDATPTQHRLPELNNTMDYSPAEMPADDYFAGSGAPPQQPPPRHQGIGDAGYLSLPDFGGKGSFIFNDEDDDSHTERRPSGGLRVTNYDDS